MDWSADVWLMDNAEQEMGSVGGKAKTRRCAMAREYTRKLGVRYVFDVFDGLFVVSFNSITRNKKKYLCPLWSHLVLQFE